MSWATKSTEDILNDILRFRERARKASRYPITKSEMDAIEIEPMSVEPKEIFRPINRAARRAKKGNNGYR